MYMYLCIYIYIYICILYIYYNRIKIDGLGLIFPLRFGGGLFQGIFQVVNSTNLRDVKYVFKMEMSFLLFLRCDCFRQVGF